MKALPFTRGFSAAKWQLLLTNNGIQRREFRGRSLKASVMLLCHKMNGRSLNLLSSTFKEESDD